MRLLLLAALAARLSAVTIEERAGIVAIRNARVEVRYSLAAGTWSAADLAAGRTIIENAATTVNDYSSRFARAMWRAEPLSDALGMGRSLLVESAVPDGPILLLRISLYDHLGIVALSAGLDNVTTVPVRISMMSPLSGASAYRGFDLRSRISMLDGNGGGQRTFVTHDGAVRGSRNNMLATFGAPGANRSLVLGGLTYNEFEKLAEVARMNDRLAIRLFAADPIGKLVEPGARYLPDDRFYVDFLTANPFDALEAYADRVRLAQNVVLPVCRFPILDMWFAQVDHFGAGMDRNAYHGYNDSLGAVEEMEAIARSGFLKYSTVAVLLEPDLYDENNQQGWWDDNHWLRGPDVRARGFWKNNSNGQFVPPYETARKWAGAIRALGGIPMIYVQTGFRSQDYAEAHPDHMIFNQPNVPHLNDKGEQQYRDKEKKIPRKLGYDYTDPGFIAHVRGVWENLRLAGIQGVKFDYPDYPFTGWPVRGGLEDPHATTAMHYRNIFRLALNGLGPEAFLHERTLERGSDVTLGLVASQRTEGDTDRIDEKMVTRNGLRWYKNRVIMNYDMDGKNPFHAAPANSDGERAMWTMSYVVTGTLMVVPSFGRMTAAQIHDLSRLYPYHASRRSARPVDAFTSDLPRVYDLRVDDGWHQLALFNFDTANAATVGVQLAGDTAFGALGLDSSKQYYVYDFWNDELVGKFSGAARLEQRLRPGEARMMSVRQVEDHPQWIATDRHLMQGHVDVLGSEWDAARRELRGVSAVVGGEAYRVIIAPNGYRAPRVTVDDAIEVRLARSNVAAVKRRVFTSLRPTEGGLFELIITRDDNGPVAWSVAFEAAK